MLHCYTLLLQGVTKNYWDWFDKGWNNISMTLILCVNVCHTLNYCLTKNWVVGIENHVIIAYYHRHVNCSATSCNEYSFLVIVSNEMYRFHTEILILLNESASQIFKDMKTFYGTDAPSHATIFRCAKVPENSSDVPRASGDSITNASSTVNRTMNVLMTAE